MPINNAYPLNELIKTIKEYINKTNRRVTFEYIMLENINDREEDAKQLTNKIFNTLDLDGNGDISYNEFLTSIIDSKKFITNDRLDKAFKLFDKDGNGKLSIDEIRAVFGGDEKKWQKIIEDIDLNDDGEVDFEEFKMLMTGVNSKDLLDDPTPKQ